MQPSKTTVIGLFNSQCQYQIPIFQRGYVWTLEKQVAPLWADIIDRADAVAERIAIEKQSPPAALAPLQKHFLGSVILTPSPGEFGRVTAFEVIDGQQRTTTLHLLLLAFRRAVESLENSPLPAMLDAQLRNLPSYPEPTDRCKVWPTQAGREEILWLGEVESAAMVCARYPVRDGRKRLDRPLMVQTYLYLYHACLAYLRGIDIADSDTDDSDRSKSEALILYIRNHNEVPELGPGLPVDQQRAKVLHTALEHHVQIMTLTLEKDDDPQVIFETLNARGEPLLASDLIRNFLFLEAARKNRPVDALYAEYWQSFDIDASGGKGVAANQYWREKERQGRLTYPRIDLFFYNYAVMRSGEVTMTSHVFHAFKAWWLKRERDLEAELKVLRVSSGHFAELVSPEGTDFIAEFARLVKALDVGTVTPVYLALRETLADDREGLRQALGDLASYLVRRTVCGFTTKSYNRFFIRVLKAIQSGEGRPQDNLRKTLLAATSVSEMWPDDATFGVVWQTTFAYRTIKPAKVCGILRAMEYAARGTMQGSLHVPTQHELTVEHVMPQGWESVPGYAIEGMTEEQVQFRNSAIHGFGNLALSTPSLNSIMGRDPFRDVPIPDKPAKPGKRTRLSQSGLQVNAYFQRDDLPEWNEGGMHRRAIALSRAACLVWPHAGTPGTPRQVADALIGLG